MSGGMDNICYECGQYFIVNPNDSFVDNLCYKCRAKLNNTDELAKEYKKLKKKIDLLEKELEELGGII